jgi:hypothetical protein
VWEFLQTYGEVFAGVGLSLLAIALIVSGWKSGAYHEKGE